MWQEKFYRPLKERVGLQDLGSVPGRGMQDLIWFSARYRNVGLNMVKFCPLISDIQIYLLTVKWTKTLKLYLYSIPYHDLSGTFFLQLSKFLLWYNLKLLFLQLDAIMWHEHPYLNFTNSMKCLQSLSLFLVWGSLIKLCTYMHIFLRPLKVLKVSFVIFFAYDLGPLPCSLLWLWW